MKLTSLKAGKTPIKFAKSYKKGKNTETGSILNEKKTNLIKKYFPPILKLEMQDENEILPRNYNCNLISKK